MPDRMPDNMPEDMPDRMPDRMPVRTCINVMVGITRSKVILSLSSRAVPGISYLDVAEVFPSISVCVFFGQFPLPYPPLGSP